MLIVQRRQQPNAGRWGFPGGVLELGETVAAGAMRELLEETGIVADPAGWLDVHDAISRDDEGRVQFHYTLIAVRGVWKSGDGVAADDAAACAWASRDDIVAGKYPTFPTLLPLFDKARAAQGWAADAPQKRLGASAPLGMEYSPRSASEGRGAWASSSPCS